MTDIATSTPLVHSKVGTRFIGGKLCLLNQKRGEVWICAGSSHAVWEGLRQGLSVPEIAARFQARYDLPPQKALADVVRFVEQMWQREILDVPGRDPITDTERAKLVREPSHNKIENPRLVVLAHESQTIGTAWLDLLIPCNLRCRHCYLDFSKTDMLPLAKVVDIVDQLKKHGTCEIILTGGEIFLRKDLLDIVAHVESRGFLFDLYTNGNFIDEKMADKLANYAIQKVQISVYGTTAAMHETITKKPGTFAKSIKAIRLLVERGIRVRMQCHIQHDNFEDAFNFPAFATSLGADYRFDTKLVPNRNGSHEPLDYGVTIGQQAQLYNAGLIDRLKPDSKCTAASAKVRINAAGDIYPCDLISNVTLGNLHKNTLEEIWGAQWRQDLRNQIVGYKPHRCNGCGHSPDCTPCAALRGFNQEGHMEATVSEACMLTTSNLVSRGKEIMPNSPAGRAKASAEQLLAQNAGELIKKSLVQITLG
jgi:radical SAM protein with 4Fe4S-binding SPASM domain